MASRDGLVIHPPQLRRVATGVDSAAKMIIAAYQTRQSALAPADGQGNGWSAAEAARTAAAAWGGLLRRLASTVGGVASAMTAAAGDYTAVDATADRRLDKCR